MSWKALDDRARGLARRERGKAGFDHAALLSELYLRLHELRAIRWQTPEHFLAFAARLMRQILIDRARARSRLKRGGGVTDLPVGPLFLLPETSPDALAVRQALRTVGRAAPRLARVLACRYLEGRTTKETAEICGISVATVKRDCDVGRAWMLRLLSAR